MRHYRFDEMKAHAQKNMLAVRAFAGSETPKDQPHSDEQWRALFALDADRLRRWQADGTLRFVDSRRAVMRTKANIG